MIRGLLLFILFASPFYALIPSMPEWHKQSFISALSANQQPDPPLNQDQIEKFLKGKQDDEIIAGEIRKSGIDFRVAPATLERLVKLGAGPLTQKALLQQEARAAYLEFVTEKDLARRLGLGKAFLERHPESPDAAKITPELRKIEIEIFESAFQTYSTTPNLSGLEQVLKLGRNLLSRYSDRATEIQVKAGLALATSKGMINNFYSDLESSRAYALQALGLLESLTPPPDVDPQTYSQLRTNSLGVIYQSLGLYLIRQPAPDSESAISYLTKAIELKSSPSTNDPVTYWLRALARQSNFEKQGEEYRALPKGQRLGKQGQSLCAKIRETGSQLIPDYAQVISLSGPSNSPQLKEEALKALNLLYTGESPCIGGRSGLIDELPDEEKRFALVIGVEDYLDKQVSKINYAASDARAVADALIRHGGFRKEQVVLLATGEPLEHQPLRSVLRQQLSTLPNGVKQDGLLLIYFVGHGWEMAGKSYLLTADSITGNEAMLADTAISVEQFKEWIRASDAGQVMLIFDAFRRTPASEAFSRQLSFDVRKNEVTAFATLLSASTGQRAYESQAKKQGVFTSVFLDAIKGKAANKTRAVTLDDMVKYLRTTVPQEAQRESGTTAQQLPVAIVEGYEAEKLDMFLPDSGRQPSNPTPAELVRNSKTICIRSKTIYLNPAVLESEMRKLPEFQALKLKIVNDVKEADLVAEITLPFLTWMWNFTVTHRSTKTPLVSSKLRGLTDDSVSPKLAKDLVTRLQEVRESTSPQK